MTTAREVIRGEDSPVERDGVLRVVGIGERSTKQKQVSSDQSPRNEEQNRSKDGILQRQGKRHEIGKRL